MEALNTWVVADCEDSADTEMGPTGVSLGHAQKLGGGKYFTLVHSLSS